MAVVTNGLWHENGTAIFTGMLEHGVEIKALSANPWPAMKWTPPRTASGGIDRRKVANPMQVRTLLTAVHDQGRVGPRNASTRP
uniref:hypothetical protein n=1 Tax=Paractinoplanes polyasparticus TaxID=2856853 RepID=UPI001C8661B3|nr:hypothetical protein [Actinoplanes polyasparticus]